MTFNSFVAAVQEEIKDYLPKEYKQARLELEEVTKLDKNYVGLKLVRDGEVGSPVLDLNVLYELYKLEGDLDKTLKKAVDQMNEIPDIDVDEVLEYEKAKRKIFIKLVSADENKEKLKEIPHKIIEDLAITYHIGIFENNDEYGSAMVTNSLINHWGIAEEQFHKDAMENAQKIFPASIEHVETVMFRIKARGMNQMMIDLMAEDIERNCDSDMVIVSNIMNMNGAAVMFYPGVMEHVSGMLKGDYYIFPSSKNEMIAVKNDECIPVKDMRNMVREINISSVDDQERLTDEVYFYDSKEKIFKLA